MGMALARAAAGDVESALTLLKAALHDAEHAFTGQHQHTIALRAAAAACYAHLGRHRDAVTEFERAATDSTALLGRNHPETVAVFDDLGNVHSPEQFSLTSVIAA
jgi:tetratricopeptide (TPR) repeat protein